MIDYVTKCALAGPVTATEAARDAVAALGAAITSAAALFGHGLAHHCVYIDTGEIAPLRTVTDKYERLYRLEIDQAWELAEEVKAFLRLHDEVRPHEALEFRRPLEIHLLKPHPFLGKVSKKLDAGHELASAASRTRSPGKSVFRLRGEASAHR